MDACLEWMQGMIDNPETAKDPVAAKQTSAEADEDARMADEADKAMGDEQ